MPGAEVKVVAERRSPQEVDWALYQSLVVQERATPNFWTAWPYIQAAGWLFCTDGAWVWFEDQEEAGVAMLLPLPLRPLPLYFPEEVKEVWADFGEHAHYLSRLLEGSGFSSSFLDYEYLFRAGDFLDLTGGKWSVFRKNARKWARYGANTLAIYRPIDRSEDVTGTLVEWLLGRSEEEDISDSEMLLEYLPNMENLWGLFRGEELVGINGWDENWVQVNFRYCICLPEPFLSDYMRLLFFTSLSPETMVNDGGVLGKPSLKFYKDKMNPVAVREIRTWKRSGQ